MVSKGYGYGEELYYYLSVCSVLVCFDARGRTGN